MLITGWLYMYAYKTMFKFTIKRMGTTCYISFFRYKIWMICVQVSVNNMI